MKHFRLGIDYLLTFLMIGAINVGAMWMLCDFDRGPEMLVLTYALLVSTIFEAIPFTFIMPWRLYRKNA